MRDHEDRDPDIAPRQARSKRHQEVVSPAYRQTAPKVDPMDQQNLSTV
jgi:hypothetical protein